MAPSCALLGGFAIGARVVLLWQHNANPSYNLASIPRYDDIVRTLGGVCALLAGDWQVTGGVLKIARTQNVSQYMIVLALFLVSIQSSTHGSLKL